MDDIEADIREQVIHRLTWHDKTLDDLGGDLQAALDWMDAQPGVPWPDERV